MTANVVSNLYYRYKNCVNYVIQDFSFIFVPGETVCIAGPSGKGKSTLIQCLTGFLQPEKGEIMYDGEEVFHSSKYKQSLAAVLQDDMLFSGTIYENISCFEEEPDVEYIYQCANIANIHQDIQCMSLGYETTIGDIGSKFSGGQKQRILIARALYRNPAILILDEATSQLDIDNEMEILKRLKSLDSTKIVVSHRPQIHSIADRVITLA